ncbi:MAG: hypothetical protein AB8B50_19725 [Pirellulaceae bacterium]
MRRILTFTRDRVGYASNVLGAARALALTAAAFACCGGGNAEAQTLAEQLAPAATQAGGTPVSSAMAIEYGGENYRTVSTSEVDAAYSVLSDSSDPSVQMASARSGPLGLARQAAYSPPVQNPCNPGCDVSLYLRYTSLWLRREGDAFFSLSRNTFIPDYDFDWGGRYTVGQLWDCVNGWEASYAGPFDWTRATTINGAGLQSLLTASNGYSAADIDTFNNATTHSQTWRTQLQSFEVSRVWHVWDVLSTSIGGRYIDFEEDFTFTSVSGAGVGLLQENVDNELLGVQIAADLQYPISLRSSTGIRGKAGAYANFSERRSFLSNAGTLVVNSGDSEVNLAGLFELSTYVNYHIVPSVRVFATYEAWWMPGMATIPEQSPTVITPATGSTVFNDDDVFLHGGGAGLEILF